MRVLLMSHALSCELEVKQYFQEALLSSFPCSLHSFSPCLRTMGPMKSYLSYHKPKYIFTRLVQSCLKKRQKSPGQETGLGNRGRLKILNDTVPNNSYHFADIYCKLANFNKCWITRWFLIFPLWKNYEIYPLKNWLI